MAKSRQKMLEKMVTFESAVIDPSVKVCARVWVSWLGGRGRQWPLTGPPWTLPQFNIKSPGPVAGGFGIRLVDVGFGFPGRPPLFQHVEFSINQDSRVWCGAPAASRRRAGG